jgi:hypothetical protein
LIATPKAFEHSGFGSGWGGINVYLNWTTGSQRPMLIFAVPDVSDQSCLKMKWLTPTHLELTYTGRQPINLQVVKCDGADISLRSLSSEGNNSSP